MKNTRPNSIFSSSLIACVLTIGSLASTLIRLHGPGPEHVPGPSRHSRLHFQMASRTRSHRRHRIQIDREPHEPNPIASGPIESSAFQVNV